MAYLNVQTWASRERGSKGESTERQQNRLDQLKTIQANVAAYWGKGQITAGEAAGLQVGDLLVLDTQAEDPGVIFVEDQPLFLARPGESPRGRYAMELIRSIPQQEVRSYV